MLGISRQVLPFIGIVVVIVEFHAPIGVLDIPPALRSHGMVILLEGTALSASSLSE